MNRMLNKMIIKIHTYQDITLRDNHDQMNE